MSHRILVAGMIHADAMAELGKAAEVEVVATSEDIAEVEPALGDADVLIVRLTRLQARHFDGAGKIKAVVRHGVGCDNLPVEALTERGIPVLTVGNANAAAVAEQALSLLFALLKQTVALNAAVQKGDWQARSRMRIGELAGRRLLVIGFGRTGRELAARAQALGMTVAAYDPFLSEEQVTQSGAAHEPDLHSALQRADAVSLHMPGGKQLIGAAELAAMPEHAVFVNCARGDLIDEQALADAVRDGSIAGAAVDVLSQEPPAADNPLLGVEGVIISPHVAGISGESLRRMGMKCAQNALDALQGRFDQSCVFNPGWENAGKGA